MIQENSDRNFLVYELWKEGRTIEEISFETGIPRSTVGYYVRKFNKCAKSGKPIVCQRVTVKPDAKAMAIQGFIKSYTLANLSEMLKNGEIDKVYKMLMICKLWKELEKDIIPTKEEEQAFLKNLGYIIEQISLAKKLTSV